jgi:hypothetical protein
MRQQNADAQWTDPRDFNVREPERTLKDEENRKRPKDEEYVERDPIAPPGPLQHHENGEQDDGPLREPLEEC